MVCDNGIWTRCSDNIVEGLPEFKETISCVVTSSNGGDRSLNLQQLNIEDQGAVARNATHALAAIGLAGRDGQTTLTTDGHALDTNVPALNDLALTQLEGERRSLLVGCVAILAYDCQI